ncbi:MAG: DUF559 domain-containing protein [Microbacterium sp.]|uniref:endonuclease domain-containing protein n=1 Tax=Microbacterium sp. TaxID=51671 RepID=UPI0039E48A1C
MTSSPILLNRRVNSLETWMRTHLGVAHSSDLRAAGFTAYDIRLAVKAGMLERVRRSWIVSTDCDPRRRQAASVGGRLTCVSEAEIHGLWVPAHERLHVAVRGNASRFDADGLRLHWGAAPAPVGRNAVEEHPLNVLFHVAHCLTRADALAVWESAIRAGVVDAGMLPRVAWRSSDAAALAAVASSLSDSGLETHFADLMRRAGITVRQQIVIDGRPVDGLIGDSLVVQTDGFAYHSSAADRRRDIAADARLVMLGYVVLRFDYYQLLFEPEQVLQTILTAMAQGLHRRPVPQIR